MYEYIISAINSVINGDDSFQFDADADYDLMLQLALKHKVENVVAYALMPYSDKLPVGIWKRFEECLYIAVMQDAQQDEALDELLRGFDNADIDHMILKGYIIKQMYPSPDMRTMGDIDILLKPEQSDKAKEVLNEQGYSITFENMREYNCFKMPRINMEIHLDMISEQYKELHNYYKDVWEKAKRCKDNSYCMSDEDYYIYHIVHLMKHYKGTGTGIRSFLDIHIYLRQKKDSLDWGYINLEFEKLGIKRFADSCIALACFWFDGGEISDTVKDMANYVCESGVYGSEEHAALYGAVQAEKTGRIKRIRSILFPNIHTMSIMYPRLRKSRYLLPFYWMVRLIKKLNKKNRNSEVRLVAEHNDKATAISDHLKSLGL